MAPSGAGKRKRGDRTYSQDSTNDGSRPSPHRPGNLTLAQQNYQQHSLQQYGYRDYQDQRGRGGRRSSRGGRNGPPPRGPLDSPNAIPINSRQTNTAMSPPLPPAQRQNDSIQAQNQPTRAATTTSTQTIEEPTSSPRVYMYEYATSEIVSRWHDSGRARLVESGTQARRDEDTIILGMIFQELIRSALDGRIDSNDAGMVIKDILGDTSAGTSPEQSGAVFDGAVLFLDSLSILTESDVTNKHLHPLVMSSGILPLKMRQELESNLLMQLGLIRDTFVRIGIRRQTNILYRQSNYNLLREESEGYSKLVTELFTTSSNEPPSPEVVEDTFERVKAMIGTFDLDVGRVLDVTLDVFAAVLVKQYRFFVKYLRTSSWWPHEQFLDEKENIRQGLGSLPKWALPNAAAWSVMSEEEKNEIAQARSERDSRFWVRVREVGTAAFFEIGSRIAGENALQSAAKTQPGEHAIEMDEDRKWIEATNTLPPQGNKIAAQILGFKLRFYSSVARDHQDILPVNLIYLAALLIKIGFISVRDLYPHLWPADDAMEAVREEKMKERAEREKLLRPGGGAGNALANAGALSDDTLPAAGRLREADGNRGLPAKIDVVTEKATTTTNATTKERVEDDLPSPVDQKVQLLKSLLCIGAIPESLYILGRFPWLLDAFPDLPEHIFRILHHCLAKVYEPLQPLRDQSELRDQHQVVDLDQAGVPKGQLRKIEQPVRKVLRWAQLDKDDTIEGTDYRFYWDDWADNIPMCQTVDDVFSLCGTLLNYVGVKIGQDPTLLTKLARIGIHSLATDASESNRARWIDLSKRLLVPALSMTKSNPGVVTEVFELIKQFSTSVRYSIYAEWNNGATSRQSDIKSAFDQVRAETKDVLKRISKTNLKQMAKSLAKVATASPGVVFAVAIGQIESYDNLVEVVVECARYFTYLGYDVLTWSLMSSLGVRGRNRVQADGMLTSKWLLSLSLFAGKAFKRYSVMNPTPILQYVTEQLRMGNSTDLIVLEQIVGSMAGIVSDTDFNEAQVLCMAGGELLQSQTMLQLLDKRHESATSARRLMKSLAEPKLAGPLLISIAQERQTCVFKIAEPDAHLKLLGNLFDEIHRVLTQYNDFLRNNLSIKDFDSLVPDITRLIRDFGIEPSVAFWISRPSIAAQMKEHDLQASERSKQLSPKSAASAGDEGDVEMAEAEGNEADNSTKKAADEPLEHSAQANMIVEDAAVNGITQSGHMVDLSASRVKPVDKLWHPVLREIAQAIRLILPEQVWNLLSERFYVTFWQLSLGDILVPTQSYDDEINRQKRKIAAINSDRSDISVAGTQKKDREKKALTELQDKLRAELKDQVSSYSQTRIRLGKEKEDWFADCWGKWESLNIALIEHCFLPRIMISPVDAIYTFKIIKYLHSSGAKNFRTMGLLDQLFNAKRLTSTIFLCTAKEADNFGRFLNEILKDLGRWHADKAVYEKEAYGSKKDLPGFSKKMTEEKTIVTFLDYEDFRRILSKWHMNLNTALKTCVAGGEYMHIRNGIIILKAVVLHFPVVNWMAQAQVASMVELSKSETREDLKIAATSLLGNLKRREKDWVLPQAFNLNKPTTNGISNSTRSSSAKPSTPQPESDSGRPLDPTAPEFKPSPQPRSDATTRTSSGRPEVDDGEDGEINDPSSTASATRLTAAANAHDNLDPSSSGSDNQTMKGPNLETQGEPEKVATTSPQSKVEQAPDTKSPSQPQGLPAKPETNMSTEKSSIPPRPSRPEKRDFADHSQNGRPLHSLPNRPDSLPMSSRSSEQWADERHGDRTLRNTRDLRSAEHGRTDRPTSDRERLSDRNNHGPQSRGYDRPLERPPPFGERERLEQSWGGEKNMSSRAHHDNRAPIDDRYGGSHSRDARPSQREERPDRTLRDRPFPEALESLRNGESQGRSSRDSSMAAPKSAVTHHPDRLSLIPGAQDPDRSYSNTHPDRRAEPPRFNSHPNSERGSRAASPARRDDYRTSRYDQPHREERFSSENHRLPGDLPRRQDDSRTPTGPRTDRTADGPSSSQSDRSRDTMRAPPSSGPPADPNHGRLNQEKLAAHRQQESQYGRLNADTPSGPRVPNGMAPATARGGARNVNAPQPNINSQTSQSGQTSLPSPSVPDRHAPTGPSSNRGPPRNGSTSFARPPPASSIAPATPTLESPDVSGVHPDRLKAIQSNVTVHPPNPLPQSNQNSLPPVSATTPVGPRGPNHNQPPSPMGASRPPGGPPTGPSYPINNDRNRSDKRFAGIQNVLQQAGGANGSERPNQGTGIRGRGGRNNNITNNNISSPSTSGPSDPALNRPDPSQQPRPDLFTNKASNNHGSGPLPYPDDDPNHLRGSRRDASDRRSTRHHESRSHSRDRHTGNPLAPPPSSMPPLGRDDNRGPRRGDDHRGRGASGGGGGGGGQHAYGDSRDRDGPRQGLGSKERERREEEWGGRGEDRERERREGGGSLRKRGRGGEEGGYGDFKRARRNG